MWSCYSSVSTKLCAYVLARIGSRGDHLTSLYTDTQREMKKLHQQAFCHLQLTIHWQRGRAVIVLLVFCVLYFAITRFMEFDHASQLASHVYCTRWPFNLRFYFVREKKTNVQFERENAIMSQVLELTSPWSFTKQHSSIFFFFFLSSLLLFLFLIFLVLHNEM